MRLKQPERILASVGAYPWAIEPHKAAEIVALLNLRAEGGELEEEELQALARGRRTKVAGQSGGVAIIPLMGVIAPRMDAMTRFSGGTSTEGFGARFDEALGNDDIGTIAIHIDSPGGSVQGVPELAAKIFAARGRKRIVAIADGLMASAAYWIGAQADEVILTPSGLVGSIGVFAIHTEVSEAEKMRGVKTTILSAGKFKVDGNPHEALDPGAAERMQSRIDEFYGMFVESIARARGVSTDAVENGLGQGGVVTSKQAMAENLVDRVQTFEEALAGLGVAASTLRETRAAVAEPHPERTVDPPALELAPAAALESGPVTLTAHDLRYVDAHDPNTLVVMPTVEHVPGEDDEVEDEDEVEGEGTDGPDGAESSLAIAAPITPTPPSGQEDTVEGHIAGTPEGVPEAGGLELRVQQDRAEARTRIDGIQDLCETLKIGPRAADFIASEMSVEQIRRSLKLEAQESAEALAAPAVELTQAEAKRYSLSRAILGHADAQLKKQEWGGFEADVSEAIEEKMPSSYVTRGGFFVPTMRSADEGAAAVSLSNARLGQMRSMVLANGKMGFQAQNRMLQQIGEMQAILDAGTATAGQELIFTEAGDFIDLLRARMKVVELGATVLTGLQGPVAFPKQDGAGTATWVAEDPGSDVADSDMTLTQVALNPNTLQSSTAYTRQLLAQNVVDVDMLVKNDLAMITALAIDLAAIAGTGASNQPTGLLNIAGIGDVDLGANGAVPDFGNIIDLETDVAVANADIGTMAYLTTPGIRGLLKQTEEFATSNGRPIWLDGELNGHRAEVSTQVPSNLTDGTGTNLHAIIFGVWSQLMIGYWGAYELVVDPYTLKKQGVIELTSFQMAGISARYPEAFSAVQDAALA